jgi:glycosyltransferase involved in cell wall biosynthesis
MEIIPNLVSVIIPTYNRSEQCQKAIQSVLNQTYTHVEVIVIDDGSTDNTRAVIHGLDPRVRYYYQNNQGVISARNHGLDRARGGYIAFLDSDDTWLPWKLEAQLAVLQYYPSAGMVFSDMTAVDEQGIELFEAYNKYYYNCYESFNPAAHFRSGRRLSEIWGKCPPLWSNRMCFIGNIFTWMFMGNLVPTPTVLLRRDRLQRVGHFDVDLVKSGEDYDFHLRTCRMGDVAYMDISSFRYRIGAHDQLSSRNMMLWIARNDLKTVKKILSVARGEINLPDAVINRRIARSHRWIGMEEFYVNRVSARRHFIKSLRLDPFQVRIILFYLLSFLPLSMICRLRGIKRSCSRIRLMLPKNKSARRGS